jgi:hypothetical protein
MCTVCSLQGVVPISYTMDTARAPPCETRQTFYSIPCVSYLILQGGVCIRAVWTPSSAYPLYPPTRRPGTAHAPEAALAVLALLRTCERTPHGGGVVQSGQRGKQRCVEGECERASEWRCTRTLVSVAFSFSSSASPSCEHAELPARQPASSPCRDQLSCLWGGGTSVRVAEHAHTQERRGKGAAREQSVLTPRSFAVSCSSSCCCCCPRRTSSSLASWSPPLPSPTGIHAPPLPVRETPRTVRTAHPYSLAHCACTARGECRGRRNRSLPLAREKRKSDQTGLVRPY